MNETETKFVLCIHSIVWFSFNMPTTGAPLVRVERVALEQGRQGALLGQCGSFTLEMIRQESKCKQRERREREREREISQIRRRTNPRFYHYSIEQYQ